MEAGGRRGWPDQVCEKTYLDDEDDDEAYIDDNEEGPEEPVRVEYAANLQNESHADGQKDLMSGVGDITVTELVNLEYRLVSQTEED